MSLAMQRIPHLVLFLLCALWASGQRVATAQSASASEIALSGDALLHAGKARASAGQLASQPMAGFGKGWVAPSQLFWAGAGPGATLSLVVDVPASATYLVELHLTRAPDYGSLRIRLDGKDARSSSFDGYDPRVTPSGAIQAGQFALAAGPHTLSFAIVGKNSRATNYLAGIDTIRLMPVASAAAAQNQGGAGQSNQANLALVQGGATLEIWDGVIIVDSSAHKYGPSANIDKAMKKASWWFQWSSNALAAKTALLQAMRTIPPLDAPLLSPPNLMGVKTIPGSLPPAGELRQSYIDITDWIHPVQRSQLNSQTETQGDATKDGQVRQSALAPSQSTFYVRLLLLDASGQAVTASSPPVKISLVKNSSNAAQVIAAGQEQQKKAEQLKQDLAMTYKIEIVHFEPTIFPDPNLQGCVKVIKNPYANQPLHPLLGFKPGKNYCPTPKNQEKSALDWVVEVVTGYIKAYQIAADFYDSVKSEIASKLASVVPCKLAGDDLESKCKGAAKIMAGSAMNAALVAAGVPPTMPSVAALEDAAEAKAVDVATDLTCEAAKDQGADCTPEMREIISEGYKKALDKLKSESEKTGGEPDCESPEMTGYIPLPCFSNYPGTQVRPVKGAVYEPGWVRIRMSQLKQRNPEVDISTCTIGSVVSLTNHFPGGYIGGINFKPADLYGEPYAAVHVPMPPVAVGKPATVDLLFDTLNNVSIPGDVDPKFNLREWFYLYYGGKGTISASFCGVGSIKAPVAIPLH